MQDRSIGDNLFVETAASGQTDDTVRQVRPERQDMAQAEDPRRYRAGWAAALGAKLPGLWRGASTIVVAELGQGLADHHQAKPPGAVEVWAPGEVSSPCGSLAGFCGVSDLPSFADLSRTRAPGGRGRKPR